MQFISDELGQITEILIDLSEGMRSENRVEIKGGGRESDAKGGSKPGRVTIEYSIGILTGLILKKCALQHDSFKERSRPCNAVHLRSIRILS